MIYHVIKLYKNVIIQTVCKLTRNGIAHAIPAISFLIHEAAVNAISKAMAINATLAIGFFDTNMCIGKESESPIGNWPNFPRKLVMIPESCG